MFDIVDSFVVQSLENTSIDKVELYPFDSDPGNYEVWDKVGQMVGNCLELQMITIHFLPYTDANDDDGGGGDESPSPIWETFTRILRHSRRKVTLCSSREDYEPEVEEIQGLAGAIHGHPIISGFISTVDFTFATMGPWCSTLATLPYLESVTLGLRETETEVQRILVNAEPLTELLRAPALRFVEFNGLNFTAALCHATTSALEKGSSITDITFHASCSFPDGGAAIITNAMKTNTSITNVRFLGDFDEPFFNSLAAVLLCNSTLHNLTVYAGTSAGAWGRWISSIFLSLGMNTTLTSLTVGMHAKLEDELCAAIRNGLANNSTLKKLSLTVTIPRGDDGGAVPARNALSFLRTNSTLKSLKFYFIRVQPFVQTQMEPYYVSAFRLEAVKNLKENLFLERLTITTNACNIQFEEFIALIPALQLNTTLKTLGLLQSICLTLDEEN
jgi:hypothetical protein